MLEPPCALIVKAGLHILGPGAHSVGTQGLGFRGWGLGFKV